MALIYPVSIGRSSHLLTQQRLLSQTNSNQIEMLNLQQQISTGRRVLAPSDDASASVRAVTLQAIIERKEQTAVNLNTARSYLNATETSVASVTDLLNQVRGSAITVAQTTATQDERNTVALLVQEAISQVTDAANGKFRERYLFAGSSTTTQPFSQVGEQVVFNGNELDLPTFSDEDILFNSNLHGHEVFGALSEPAGGDLDINPVLTGKTLLSDLRGGRGIDKGSFVISDGVNNNTIDISGAVSVGDVVSLIEANPPAGRQVTVRIVDGRLDVELDEAGGGNLSIRESGGGTTAAELGLYHPTGSTTTLTGDDLNPVLRGTTLLSDAFGVRAATVLRSSGSNNDIIIEALQRGDQQNGVAVQVVNSDLLQATDGVESGSETVLVSDTAVAARASVAFTGFGNDLVLTAANAGVDANNITIEIADAGAIGDAATVSYDSFTKRLTIGVDTAGATTVQSVIDQVDAHGLFTAAYDTSNVADGGFNAAATINTGDIGVVTGDTGNSGGAAGTVFVFVEPGSTTAQQTVDALNADATFAASYSAAIDEKDTATISSSGRGTIDTAATATLTGGSGVEFDLASGLQINNGGETYNIDFQGATTIEDLLNTLNGSAAGVRAEINSKQTGILIRSRLSGSDFSVGENGGDTASQLGVRTFDESTPLAGLNHGFGVHTVEDAADFVIRRNDGVELEFDISSAVTVGDVIDIINNHPDNSGTAGVTAQLRSTGNGIELIDDNPQPGASLTVIKDLVSEAAWDLGLVPRTEPEASATGATAATGSIAFDAPANLNNSFQVTANTPGSGLNNVQIEFVDALAGDTAVASYDSFTGVLQIQIDSTQTTAATVVAAIDAENTFNASLETSTGATNDGSGLIPATGVVATTAGGTAESIAGEDTNPLEVEGVFNSLVRLHEAILTNDLRGIQRATESLDADLTRINFSRGELGSRVQSLDVFEQRSVEEDLQLRSTLSIEIEVDLVAAISDLNAKQAAFQASLQLTGQTFQLSLMNFL